MLPNIVLDKKSKTPLYIQIKKQIQEMIYQGLMQEGEMLQPTRKLADALGVNRRTVIAAYEEMKAESVLEARVGKGTVVKKSRTNEEDFMHLTKLDWVERINYSPKSTTQAKAIFLNALADEKEFVSFSSSVPDPAAFPVKEFKRILNRLLDKKGRDIFRYSPSEGIYPLREYLADRMLAKGKIVKPSEVLITNGALQGLSLVLKILVKPGDIVVVERPTAFGSIQILRSCGARIVEIPTDSLGMKTDVLERFLSLQKPKLIYTIPTFQNPSGFVMSLERRKKLLELCKKYRVPVVEDDPYSELYFENEPPPSLKALDTHNFVIYLSSFTKTMFPGLRVGWVIAPQQVVERLAEERRFTDIHTNTMSQYAINEFGRSGLFEIHLENLRKLLLRKRNLMIALLKKHCYASMTWNKPEGGISLWCRLEKRMSSLDLLKECYYEKVMFLSGDNFFSDGKGEEWLRINYSYTDEAGIEEGINRLARALQKMNRRGNPQTGRCADEPVKTD